MLKTLICSTILIFLFGVAFAQDAADKPQCMVTHDKANYITWMCDGEGKVSKQFSIFFVRENARKVNSINPIWVGSSEDWAQQYNDAIDRHYRENQLCRAYFHIARLNGEQAQWNFVTKTVGEWWAKEGKRDFRELCYTSEPASADYVIFWSEKSRSHNYSYSVPVPQRSYTSGYTSGWVNGQYVSGYYSGYVTSTRMQNYDGEWNSWEITATALPKVPDGPNKAQWGTPLTWSQHTGKWRWSKPDKDSVIDLLKAIQNDLSR